MPCLLLISSWCLCPFFAGDAISGEFEKKTVYSVFTLPQKKTTMFMGKQFSTTIMAGAIIGLYYLVVFAETKVIYHEPMDHDFWASLLVALLYTAGAVGLTFLFSAFLPTGIQSTLLSFFTLLLIMPIAGVMLMVAKIEPWFFITYQGELVTDVFGARPIETGYFTITVPDYTQGIIVMLIYATIIPLIGILYAAKIRTPE